MQQLVGIKKKINCIWDSDICYIINIPGDIQKKCTFAEMHGELNVWDVSFFVQYIIV